MNLELIIATNNESKIEEFGHTTYLFPMDVISHFLNSTKTLVIVQHIAHLLQLI